MRDNIPPNNVGDPTNHDRMPDYSDIGIEHVIRGSTTSQNVEHATTFILRLALIGILVSIVLPFFTRFVFLDTILPTVMFIGMVGFLYCFFAKRSNLVRITVLVAGPAVWFLAFIIQSDYLFLLLAMSATALVADSIATHWLYYRTTSPFPRPIADELRKLWNTRATTEYRRSILVFVAAFFLVVLTKQRLLATDYRHYAGGLSLLLATLFVICTPFLFGLVHMYRVKRDVLLPVSTTCVASFHAMLSWFTYNLDQVKGPGVFASPSGNYKQRSGMGTAALVLLSVAVLRIANYFPVNQPDAVFFQNITQRTPDDGAPFLATLTEEAFVKSLTPSEKLAYGRLALDAKKRYKEAEMNLRDRRTTVRIDRSVTKPTGGWMLAAFGYGYTKDDASLYYLLASVIFSILGPLVFFFALCFATTARVSAFLEETARRFPAATAPDGKSPSWDTIVNDIHQSPNRTANQSIFIGHVAATGAPVLVPRKVFAHHAHILGATGTGKTSLGFVNLVTQLIRFGDSSVVILDLKGDDQGLFEVARTEAGNARRHSPNGLPFKWFTNRIVHSTFAFNPFSQFKSARLSTSQMADVVTNALGLQYGTDFGRGYFTSANADILFDCLERNPNVGSFRELCELLDDRKAYQGHPQLWQAASHIHAVVKRLASVEQLNISPRNLTQPKEVLDASIDFASVVRQPQVVYFNLPSTTGQMAAPEIGRLALQALLEQAAHTPRRHRKQVYVFIDEFQNIVAKNVEKFLQMARSYKLGFILANQGMQALKTNDIDLTHTLVNSTNFKQVFSIFDGRDQADYTAASGETLDYLNSVSTTTSSGGSTSRTSRTRTYSEQVGPRLRANDILQASDDERLSIVKVTPSGGFAQFRGMPFLVKSDWRFLEKVYENMQNADWPAPPPGAFVPELSQRSSTVADDYDPVIHDDDDDSSGPDPRIDDDPKLLP